LVQYDRSIVDTMHAYASEVPNLTTLFRVFGILGSLGALALVGVLVAVALLVRRTWLMGRMACRSAR
jgi:hypothetical protein